MNVQFKRWTTPLLALLVSSLVACGGGGGNGGDDNPIVDIDPTLDTDGDGLTDVAEIENGTNRYVADTDGDGFLDKEEVDNWDQNSGTHLRFNPLVADVPRLRVEALGSPVIQLFATTLESGSINKGMTNENSTEVVKTTDRGRTNVNEIEEQHAVSVNGTVKSNGAVTTGQVDASYDYEHTDTTTETNYWNETTVATNRQASSDYYETLRTETVTTKGGEIKVLMGLLNDGDVSFTVNNMDLTAYMENPQAPGDLIAVGTLIHEGDMSFTPSPLGTTVNPTSGDFTPFNFVYKADNNPEEISRILESSSQLVLKPANLSLTGQRVDVDLSLAAQNIRARTAEVIIDFGDGQIPKTERYRVAIDTDNNDTLGFSELMNNRLNFNHTFSSESFPAASGSHSGLSSVRNVSMNTSTNSYWLVAHTFTPVGSPAGTTDTVLYNILNQDYSAEDINLRKGDVLHLVYVTDSDLDGLSDRLEVLEGTDMNVPDSDGDGLDDAQEFYGWLTNLASAPCDQGSLTLVFGDPLAADTDGDGLSDSGEFSACSNPYGELIVDAGANLLANKNQSVTLSASPENFLNASALSYQWVQTGGASVGPLPNARTVSFSTPDEVTNLEFQVTVIDTDQNNSTAFDQVSVLVAEDKTTAVFVDPDNGHDFNNTGRTPDSPLASIERALDTAFGGADIYLNTPDSGGFYDLANTINLPTTASLYGGFDLDWSYDPANAPTPIRVNQAVALQLSGFTDTTVSGISVEALAPVDGKVHSQAILASDGGNLILDRIIAQGSSLIVDPPANANIPSYVAASSYGVFATGLNRLDVIDSSIIAGKGANGVKGQPGTNGKPGDRGTNASGTSGGGGGSGHNGANGGKGANADTGIVFCTKGFGGSKGGDSTSSSNSTITGGSGGSGATAKLVNFGTACEIKTAGSGGSKSSTVAKSGTQVAGADNSITFISGLFTPAHGATGSRGSGGAGGGGGGSGAGYDFNLGGGGGGGGEGGEGGYGGKGGRGAGGSFGLTVDTITFTSIINSTVSSGDGGLGGAGGNGGAGGEGGGGGTGDDSGARKGGNGGKGGWGGNGGPGGGGAGGPVAGLLVTGGSVIDIIDTQIITANAGNATNAAQGGWNYGIYVDSGNLSQVSGVSYQLGSAGNGASVSETNP